jgi:exo-beta-1,3-glucanase (GH17 family)
MLRHISTTFGSAMAALCLVSTLAMAQPQTTTQDSTRKPQATASESQSQYQSGRQAQHMTCIKDDGMGNCTAAVGADGKNIVVVGNGAKTGDAMTCVDLKSVVECKPAS